MGMVLGVDVSLKARVCIIETVTESMTGRRRAVDVKRYRLGCRWIFCRNYNSGEGERAGICGRLSSGNRLVTLRAMGKESLGFLQNL
ncbi:hypothetical protein CEXT_242861 [Caerostris extrusa]|uniref:Ribosomal protein L14 n=1 Tax=Caerostris extrusa TaxID=172846 RepID=A0AAV4P1S5_CAEEX|nr:hypothetical protein CEXT_242861 [Caerostris extrusa]